MYPKTAAVVFIHGYVGDFTKMSVSRVTLESVKVLMESFQQVGRGERGKVTFIIDEADIARGGEKGGEAWPALALLTKLTKQDEQV